jgi:hypothetical protein
MPRPTPTPPGRTSPNPDWPHFQLWQRVSALFYALPNYFETELTVKGINATEVFSIGAAFAAVVETQVVTILNGLRNIWDPENRYPNHGFARQAQTFPDVLLRNLEDDQDILFGIELKSWYVLSKEGEPSFRYTITPDACAPPDLLVVLPWILSDVISGNPRLLSPYKESAKYAAQYRNFHWQRSRQDRGENPAIHPPPPENQHPYPASKQQASDEAEDDKGNNFGRLARSGIIDDYINTTKGQHYLGIKLAHWIAFFRAITETGTDTQIESRLGHLRQQVLAESDLITDPTQRSRTRDLVLEIVRIAEQLWQTSP